ncbi:MAG: hypothetical protein DMG70_13860 [Acidobacteria bacterium]|nr:MAG: hypothetical protein DMG70_13860 [Acidobacteriota bacterium]
MLDIAAGHGLFGITLAKRQVSAEVGAVDWKHVLAVARENAQGAGIGQRYRTVEGSAFDVEFGTAYDLALITNFIHHFDGSTNKSLLHKVHAALTPGGTVAAVELVPPRGPGDAAFSR